MGLSHIPKIYLIIVHITQTVLQIGNSCRYEKVKEPLSLRIRLPQYKHKHSLNRFEPVISHQLLTGAVWAVESQSV